MPTLFDITFAALLITIGAVLIWIIHHVAHFCDKHIPDTPIMPRKWTAQERRKRKREAQTNT